MSDGYKWKPLSRAVALPASEQLIAETMAFMKCDRQTALDAIHSEDNDEIWMNDLYQVVVRRGESMIHLNIRRIDGYPGRVWRHLQQIKNELVGPECEAVELFPAESRLVDLSNKYHLWCVIDPKFRFPFGFEERSVHFGDSKLPGHRQAPEMKRR